MPNCAVARKPPVLGSTVRPLHSTLFQPQPLFSLVQIWCLKGGTSRPCQRPEALVGQPGTGEASTISVLDSSFGGLRCRYLVECSVPGHKDLTVPAQIEVPHLADHPAAAEALRSCLQVLALSGACRFFVFFVVFRGPGRAVQAGSVLLCPARC